MLKAADLGHTAAEEMLHMALVARLEEETLRQVQFAVDLAIVNRPMLVPSPGKTLGQNGVHGSEEHNVCSQKTSRIFASPSINY